MARIARCAHAGAGGALAALHLAWAQHWSTLARKAGEACAAFQQLWCHLPAATPALQQEAVPQPMLLAALSSEEGSMTCPWPRTWLQAQLDSEQETAGPHPGLLTSSQEAVYWKHP